MQKSCLKVLIKNILTYIMSSLILALVIYLFKKVNTGGLSLAVATAPILILDIVILAMSIGNIFGFIYVIKSDNIGLKVTGIIMLVFTIAFIVTTTIYIFKFLNILGII